MTPDAPHLLLQEGQLKKVIEPMPLPMEIREAPRTFVVRMVPLENQDSHHDRDLREEEDHPDRAAVIHKDLREEDHPDRAVIHKDLREEDHPDRAVIHKDLREEDHPDRAAVRHVPVIEGLSLSLQHHLMRFMKLIRLLREQLQVARFARLPLKKLLPLPRSVPAKKDAVMIARINFLNQRERS
jgi:hypothetical protein